MPVLPTTDPDIVRVSAYPLAARVAGLFFGVMGCAVLTAASRTPSQEAGFFIMLGLGFLGLIVGGGLALYRGGVVVNRREKKVLSWAKLLIIPLKSQEHSLSDVTKVLLASEDTEHARAQSTRSYHVRLATSDGWILAAKSNRYDMALDMAEELAKFLGLPLDQNVQITPS